MVAKPFVWARCMGVDPHTWLVYIYIYPNLRQGLGDVLGRLKKKL